MIRTLLALLPAESRRYVAGYVMLTVLGVVLRAAGSVLLVPLVVALFSAAPASAWHWLGILTLVTVAGWIVDWAAAQLGFKLGFGILDNGQHAVADQITSIRLNWFTADNTATTRQAVAATGPDLVGLIVYLVTPMVGGFLLPVVIAIALVPIAWQLGAAALAGVVVLPVTFWLAGRLSRSADRETDAANSRLTERVLEFARTQEALRAARRVEPARSHVGAALRAQHGAAMKTLLLQVPGDVLFGLASQIALLALAGTTVVLTLQQTLSVPQAIALIVVIIRYLEPFTVLAELSPGIETVTGSVRRIREVLRAPQDRTGDATLQAAEAPRIELRGVGFCYADDAADGPAVLEGFDLTVEPGSTVAIVGPSGSGKSTVLALVAGLHEPHSGRVLIDGHDLATLDATTRRRLVSVVFQHPYLFDGSVRENVLVGDLDASAESVDAVARLARIDSLVARLPDGWGSRVGEAGVGLSGGERQRVSIARALLKPAPVLLVDEATSALDAENETAIAAAFSHDPIPRTRLIVAHRLSSIRSADRVVFLEHGTIIEDGTIPELLAANGRFAEFWRQQEAASAWTLGTPESI